MNIRSLGYRTDLIFPRHDAEVIERDEYIVIRTPSNPGFYWGNFLLFREAPREGDSLRWEELFSKEIGAEKHHRTYGWDSPEAERGASQEFLDLGFRIEHLQVLRGSEVRKNPQHNSSLTVRPLKSDADWQAAVEEGVDCREERFDAAGYRLFIERQLERYRRMSDLALGGWFGAFEGDRLVGDLGIFRDGNLGRYQSVKTRPSHRRQGVCSTLVYESAQIAFHDWGIKDLVIAAVSTEHALGIYRSVGFERVEEQIGLEKA